MHLSNIQRYILESIFVYFVIPYCGIAFAFSLAVTSLEVVAAKDTGHAVAAILTATAALKILLVAFFMFCFSSFFWKHLIYPVLCLCSQYRKNNMFFKEAVFDFTLHFLISALYTAME